MKARELVVAAACLTAGYLMHPLVTHAESGSAPKQLWVEPGTVTIPTADGGSSMGKIVVDMSTGDVYGFQTFGKAPYPGYRVSENQPLTSQPIYLGKYNFAAMRPNAVRGLRFPMQP